MNGVLLLPTYNRVEKLKEFLKSYVETKATIPLKILVDAEDLTENKSAYDSVALPEFCSIINTDQARSMGDKCRWIWPSIKDLQYSWVGLLNDDHYCITPEWDQKAEKLIDGTNMVSTNDGNWNFGVRVAGLTAWSTPLLEAVDFPIFPRNLQHLCIDDVWKQIGDATGCWLETMKINIEHRHVFKGAPNDSTHERVYAQSSWEYDGKEFTHFMEQDFKDVCLKVMKLREKNIEKLV